MGECWAVMRNWSKIILDIENYFLANSNFVTLEYFNNSDGSDLFSGEAGDFIKQNYLNSSSDAREYLEVLNKTIFNVTQLMQQIGYGDVEYGNFW